MAAPVRVYDVTWVLKLTTEQASTITFAAADAGQSRREWIRQACAEKAARDKRKSKRGAA
jgi:uncharacterized protein (DUF1778 family)